MTHKIIAFIGAGKMANALIAGLIRAGRQPENIWVSCPTQAHLDILQARFGVCVTQDNTAAASHADVLLLAVKPQYIFPVLDELRSVILSRQPLIISIAASITETAITEILGHTSSVVRAMPNTPALIGHGMTAFYAEKSLPQIHKQQAEAIFQAVGGTLWVDDENQMNAVTALSGSGPAYFFSLMEALEKAGTILGLSPEIARHLIVQTAIGSAYMAAENTQSLHALREQVTSPGGGTASAMAVLESEQFPRLILDAVTAAKVRYDEMG